MRGRFDNMTDGKLNTAWVPVDSVQPHPKNVRHGDVGAICESLKAHGQYRPIVVQQSTGYIVAGNHTWRAVKALRLREVAATFLDVDDEQALRIMLVDNKTADLATYDDHALLEMLTSLATSQQGLTGTGFDGDDIDSLTALLNHEALQESEKIKERKEREPLVCPDCGYEF